MNLEITAIDVAEHLINLIRLVDVGGVDNIIVGIQLGDKALVDGYPIEVRATAVSSSCWLMVESKVDFGKRGRD